MNGDTVRLRRQLCTRIQQVRSTLASLEDDLLEIDHQMRRLEAKDPRAPESTGPTRAPRVDPDLNTGITLPIAAG